jgi:hypothetical protein
VTTLKFTTFNSLLNMLQFKFTTFQSKTFKFTNKAMKLKTFQIKSFKFTCDDILNLHLLICNFKTLQLKFTTF